MMATVRLSFLFCPGVAAGRFCPEGLAGRTGREVWPGGVSHGSREAPCRPSPWLGAAAMRFLLLAVA